METVQSRGTCAGTAERPTLADVAQLAGVSLATASRVLNRSARVSPQALSRVEDAVRRLGYVRNRAQHATARCTGAVAVVIFEEQGKYQSDSFYTRMLVGAEQRLIEAGRQLVVITVPRRAPRVVLERYLCGGHVDGVLLVGMHDNTPVGMLRAAGVPAVSLGRPPGDQELPYVDADNQMGAQNAVRHLVRSGRRSIATIAGPPDMSVGADRLAGYRSTVSQNGACEEALVAYGNFTVASGEHAMLRLLDRRPRLDAVFAASDLMAVGALRALVRSGRRVPDDVAVVGFDDAEVARRSMPMLTTVRQPVEEMGATLVGELLRDTNCPPEDPTRHVVLSTELVVRDSA